MSLFRPTEQELLQSIKRLNPHLVEALNSPVSLRLWDGSIHPLGHSSDPALFLSISDSGVIGSLLRRPTVENVVMHYTRGQIDFHGADLLTFIEAMRVKNSRKRARNIRKWPMVKGLFPFLFAPAKPAAQDPSLAVRSDENQKTGGDNRSLIQFHYDVGNDFYKLFLDENMVYSCAYFTDWSNTLEQAQLDKLDMICRKLQLKPGETLLDIGCGWGALICHAAEHYGVEAHGVTLSQAQLEYARKRIGSRGLEGRVTVELKDYNDVQGRYDKIASIGMIEHVGIANLPNYMAKVNSLLPDRGIFLNHGITRPGKRSRRRFRRVRPEQRIMRKYIFPGGELDHIGHTIEQMEAHGFRVHDVEGWRDHYALTCRHWCQRLWDNREEAARLVGRERYRLWLAYLAGVSLSFSDGALCLFQTVTVKQASKGHSQMPPTRQHLYETESHSTAGKKVA
jgi:cyclopropane-fatty-acyl-phospholipid synthase